MKRKVFAYLPLFILALLFVACGAQPQTVDVTPAVEQAVEKPAVEPSNESQAVEEAPEVEFGAVAETTAVPLVVAEAGESETADEISAEADSAYDEAPASDASTMARDTELVIEPEPIIPESPLEPDTMLFDGTTENPFVDTRDDRFSTFAIDVDTGSYTLMRSYLSDYGQLPPTDSVRVEEYINYFDYGYENPRDGAFAIHLEGAPAPYGENENYHLLRVGVQGYDVPDDERSDMLLIFVIDVSGSMAQENRLGLVKESLRLLVNTLRPTDRVGIVVYGSQARSVLDPTYITEDRAIQAAIDHLETEGSTNVEDGIRLGYRMANRYALDGQATRLIVLSDGVANVGRTTAEEILENARRGVSLSTFGFGMGNYNDALMEQLADQGDGTYAYIDTLREAQRWFVTGLTSTLVTIAKDAKIQVEFNPAVVETYRLIGYENRDVADADFRNDAVDAGEIGAGHSVTALYEVRLAEDIGPADEALTVRVRYQDIADGEVVEIARALRPNEFHNSYSSASDSFQLAATVAEFGELLKDSYWARNGSLETVWRDAEQLAVRFSRDRDVQQFVDLVESAAAYAR